MNKNHLAHKAATSRYASVRRAKAERAGDDGSGNAHTEQPVDNIHEQYLTRREAARYVREILGRPISFSTASKLAAVGEFAPAALWWGRRPLYRRDDLRSWAEARSRSTKECGT
jgi:hypothetical protein